MKTNRRLTALLFIGLSIQGCATVMQGGTQQITVGSVPPGATVVVDGFQRLKTPVVVELSRKEPHRLEISMDGYHTETVEIRNVSSSMPMGNVIAGGLIGFAIDHSTGAAFRLVPEIVHVSLRPAVPEKLEAQATTETPADDPNEPVN